MRTAFLASAALALTIAIGGLAPAHAQDDMRARGDKACNVDAKKL